jgi:hypothetical protein
MIRVSKINVPRFFNHPGSPADAGITFSNFAVSTVGGRRLTTR